jgi:hypothetical protein
VEGLEGVALLLRVTSIPNLPIEIFSGNRPRASWSQWAVPP